VAEWAGTAGAPGNRLDAELQQYTFGAMHQFFAFDESSFPHDSGNGSVGRTRLGKRARLRCL
jgi:hypothetical protein